MPKGSPEFLRKVLVVSQFTLSITLIIGSVVMYRQVGFLKTGDMGFNKQHIITIPVLDRKLKSNYENLKTQFLQNPDIINICIAYYLYWDRFALNLSVAGKNGIA